MAQRRTAPKTPLANARTNIAAAARPAAAATAAAPPPNTTAAAAEAAPQLRTAIATPVMDQRMLWKDVFVTQAIRLPTLHGDLQRRLSASADLRALLNAPPSLSSRATHDLDGRKDRIVMVVARDKSGAPARGVLVRLLENGALRDHTRTDARGVALLLEPRNHAHDAKHHPAGPLAVEALMAGREPMRLPVQIAHGKQHQIMELIIDPPLATDIPLVDSPQGEAIVPAGKHMLTKALKLTGIDLADNPLDRLPTDFSTDLCQDMKAIIGPTQDPIFDGVDAPTDFRRRRVPIVKRMTIPRIGQSVGGKPPRRYLVRVRQEWTFLGYTLGELQEVESLDPGAVLDETTRSVTRAVQIATRAVDHLVSRATQNVSTHLDQASTIDNLLQVASSVKTKASAGGWGFHLGPFAMGELSGSVGVTTNASVRNRTDTSLEVNSSLHAAKTVVNQAIRTVSNVRRDVSRSVATALNQVSPLLSRVTNLVRWTMYENYMVCTHVEDVLEVADVPIADLGSPTANLFTDEQIVDLRRVFEPGLLERSLRPNFDTLATAVNARRGAELPIVAAHVTIDYSPGQGGATLTARIGSDEATIQLRPGTHRTTQTIRLAAPLDDSAITSMDLDLVLGPSVTLWGGIAIPNSAAVSRIEIAYQTASGFIRRQSVSLGDTLRVDQDDRTAGASVSLSVPPPAVFTQHDPLVVHINRNRTYYFGLLCQAALFEPSLRDDLPHFGAFDGDHELWRLPIVGFEGNRALVVKDADQTLSEVQELLADPGAATLVQIAAPGAYSEALQGLLKLAVDVEKLHPALLAPLAPVMPPLALVDMTGKTIPVLDGGATDGVTSTVGGTTGGTTGSTLPSLPIP